jgi:hypothetical protein
MESAQLSSVICIARLHLGWLWKYCIYSSIITHHYPPDVSEGPPTLLVHTSTNAPST